MMAKIGRKIHKQKGLLRTLLWPHGTLWYKFEKRNCSWQHITQMKRIPPRFLIFSFLAKLRSTNNCKQGNEWDCWFIANIPPLSWQKSPTNFRYVITSSEENFTCVFSRVSAMHSRSGRASPGWRPGGELVLWDDHGAVFSLTSKNKMSIGHALTEQWSSIDLALT